MDRTLASDDDREARFGGTSRSGASRPRRVSTRRGSMDVITEALRTGQLCVERLMADMEELGGEIHERCATNHALPFAGAPPQATCRTPAPPPARALGARRPTFAVRAPPSLDPPGAPSVSMNWSGVGLARVQPLLHIDQLHAGSPAGSGHTPHYLKQTALSAATAISPEIRQLTANYLKGRLNYLRSLDDEQLMGWRYDVVRCVRERAEARRAVLEEKALRWKPPLTAAEREARRLQVLQAKKQKVLHAHDQSMLEHERREERHGRAQLRRLNILTDEEVRGCAFAVFMVHVQLVTREVPRVAERGRAARQQRRVLYLHRKYFALWRRRAQMSAEKNASSMRSLHIHLLHLVFRYRIKKKRAATATLLKFLHGVAETTAVFRAGRSIRLRVTQISRWWRATLTRRARFVGLLAKRFVLWHVEQGCLSEKARKKRALAVKVSPLFESLEEFDASEYLSTMHQCHASIAPSSQQAMLLRLCALWIRDQIRNAAPALAAYKAAVLTYLDARDEQLGVQHIPNDLDTQQSRVQAYETSADAESCFASKYGLKLPPPRPYVRFFMAEEEMRVVLVHLNSVKWVKHRKIHLDEPPR